MVKRVAICHNDANQRGKLRMVLAKYLERKAPEDWAVDTYLDSKTLLETGRKYDILLISAVMPKDAAALNEKLRKNNRWLYIIYLGGIAGCCWETTCLLHAADHLARPFNRLALFRTIKQSLEYLHWAERGKRLVFHSGVDILLLCPEDIYYIETMKTHKLHFVGEAPMPNIRMAMHKAMEIVAPYGFAQPNRGYTVNLLYVNRVTSNMVYLADGSGISLARSKTAAFRAALEEFWR